MARLEKLRALYLTQTFPRHDHDTAGPFIRELARGLVRGGDEVTVLVPHAEGVAESWTDEGVVVRSFRYAPERFELLGYGRSLQADERIKASVALTAPCYLAGAQRALAHELGSQDYDIVHAHWIVPNGTIASTVRHFAKGGAKLALGLHGSDVFLAEKWWARAWVRKALARSVLVTGCSPELVDRIRALDRRPDQRCWQVIPYGVDSRMFSPLDRDGEMGRREWREELGISPSESLLLGVGRLATKKGYQVLIAGLAPLMEELPELRVVLAGGGDREQEFRRAAEKWGRRVLFPGSVPRDRLPGLYRAADLFVLPAVHDSKGNVDGLPNVILEAMATGLAIVATRVSGIPIAVRNEQEGLLVAEGDAESLAAALRRLLLSPSERAGYGEAGRRRVVSELTWDQVAARHRAAYSEVLSP